MFFSIKVLSDTPKDAFEKGAGFSLADISGLLSNNAGVAAFIFISWGVLSTFIAWRSGKISFAELGGTVFQSIFFLVVLLTFIGVVSTTATFK